MKNIFFALALVTTHAFADESALVITNETSKVETQASVSKSANSQPDWKFLIGESNVNNGYSLSGKGLTFGAGYILSKQISFGGSYTKFKTDNTFVSYDYGYTSAYSDSYKADLDFITFHTEFTPIRYEIGQFGFSGSILIGASNSRYDSSNYNETNLFYGAAAALNINNQIGFSFDTKVSKEFSSLSSVSMIGYY